MFDPDQTVSQQPDINHPENIDLELPEGQMEQDIEIERKILKGIHFSMPIKEIQAVYLTSPCFKKIYLYLV